MVQDTLEAAADPQTVANGYVQDCVDRRRRARSGSSAAPVQFDGEPPHPGARPEFNEHGDDILAVDRPRLGHDHRPQGPRRRRLTLALGMDTLDAVLERAPRATAWRRLDVEDRAITYSEVAAQADDWSRTLRDVGVGPGARVALMSGNRLEFVFAAYGALQLGAAVVMCSPAWKARELEHACALTAPGFAVTDEPGAAAFTEVRPDIAVVRIDEAPATPGPERVTPADDIDADAVLVFSSGTTGLPKAVRHTHRTMGHGVAHWITALGLTADDRFQVATPPVHILGLLNIVTAVAAGAPAPPPTLRSRQLLAAIERDRVTLEMAVAPIALGMANHPALERFDLSSLRYVMWGATPVTPEVAATVTRRSGVRWLPCYGTSEVPVLTANPVDQPDEWRLDSPGLPIPASAAGPGTEIRICDPVTGEILGPDRTGEIEVRSPSAMVGYLPADATADAFHDGWYRTGDLGHLESSGWLHITDRLKEMIKVRGYQFAPAEVEAVLHADPRVRLRGVRRARRGPRRGRRRRGRGGGRRVANRRRSAWDRGVTTCALQAGAPRGVRRRGPPPPLGQGPPPRPQGPVHLTDPALSQVASFTGRPRLPATQRVGEGESASRFGGAAGAAGGETGADDLARLGARQRFVPHHELLGELATRHACRFQVRGHVGEGDGRVVTRAYPRRTSARRCRRRARRSTRPRPRRPAP